MKKILSITLLLLIILSVFPASVFAQWEIRNPSQAKGSNYTNSEDYAKALDAVFAGDIDVFLEIGCKNEQSMPLGYSMNTSKQYFAKSKATGVVYSGYQCYIYANAVYNKLFGEVPYHGTNLHHSKVVMKGSGGKNTVTYQEFVNAGIRSGAYIRTTPLSNNAYYGNDGHSMVLLYYDEGGVVYIEGNADGYGLVRIFNQTWAEFNNTELKGVGRYLCHIVQANDSYYEQHYPENKEVKEYLKKCTFYPASYSIKAVKEANLRNMPCNTGTNAASEILYTLPVGTKFTATGIYKNTEGNYWYRLLYNNKEYYLYAKNTTALSIINDAKITGAKYPTTLIKGNAYTLEGVVSSKYVTINSLIGQVYNSSGKLIASKTVSVTNNSYSIKNSALDMAIKFNELAAGNYRLVLAAEISSKFVTDSQSLSSTGLCVNLLEKSFTVHEHKYVASGTESAHPHRSILKCSCGDVKYGSENFSKKVVVTSPTCAAEGKEETLCTVCGKVLDTKTIAKTSHGETYEKITLPTCLQAGKNERICVVCGTAVNSVTIPALSHTITVINKSPSYTGDEYCTTCKTIITKGSEIVPEFILGDVNLDGKITAADATQILRYANSKSSCLTAEDAEKVAKSLLAADVDGNGKISASDATQILRFVNGKPSVLSK